LAKENCFSIRGGSEENQFFHTEKLPRSKREEFSFHTIRVEVLRARRRVLKSK
jgi:2-methylaconitate cis-trans-isomerase PrpF